jgi:hypothetical protein
MSAPPTTRPTGITILAILAAILGVLSILAGIALIGLGGLAAGVTGQSAWFGLGGFFGLITLASGVAYIAFAYGGWTLQPWAWPLGVILQLITLVLAAIAIITGLDNIGSAITSQIVGVAIAVVILYYLFQPSIKSLFGK